MRLTTKCRYGTRAMIEIGMSYGAGSVQLNQISRRQKISPKYLVHLLASLKAAGLVKTVRGARGGYLVDRPPSRIKLSEIFRALEGSPSPVDCVDDPTICPESELCVARRLWTRIRDAISQVLESTTLQDLIDQRRELELTKGGMYHI